MAPITKKQKRDNKKLQETEQLIESIKAATMEQYKQTTITINSIYSCVNVIDMTADLYTAKTTEQFNNNLKRLKDLTRDHNNFIIIFNKGAVLLHRFLQSHLHQVAIPKQNIILTDSVNCLLFRDDNTLICPKQFNDDELKSAIKKIFKDEQANIECIICYNEIKTPENRAMCVNCYKVICCDCMDAYLLVNPGWCPMCRQHIYFENLKQPDDTDEEFNMFVKSRVLSYYKETPNARFLITKQGEGILETYNELKRLQQHPLFYGVDLLRYANEN
jgi:hypothetical protein